MKPSSKNEVMNGIVNAYITQKVLDKHNNTHYADTWKILNGADDEIDASLKFDLSEVEWSDIKAHLKANNIAFTLCLISYKDGHSQNSFVWYDDGHIYATEMNEIGSVTFHVVDNVNKEAIKPTDETSSSLLKMLLALENGGANGGGGETTTKQVFKGGVDILDKPLDVESKATFGRDVEVDGNLTLNSASNLKTKDGTSFGEGLSKPWFSSNEYIGILSKSVTTSPVDDYLSGLYNVDGTVGLIAQNNKSGVIASFIPSLNADFPIFMYQGNDVQSLVQLPDKFFTESTIITLGDGLPPYVYTYNASTDGKSGVIIKEHLIGVQAVTSDKKYNSIGLNVTENFVFATFNDAKNNNTLYILPDGLSSDFVNTVSVPAKTGTIALIEDLATKQSVLYRHTITIYGGNENDGNSICLTTYTPSNTPIDSIQDLTASVDGSNKLANVDLECFGVSGSASALTFYNKIHVGTDLSNTTLQKATGGSVALSSVYSTYTITDDVSLN